MNRIRNPRRLFLVTIFIDVIIFVILLFFLSKNFNTDPTARFILIIYFAALIIVGGVVWYFFRPMLKEQSIMQKGSPAMAILLDYWDTGTTINQNPLVEMLLEVHSPLLAIYQVKTKTVLSRLDLGMLRKGAVVKATYLPEDPRKVAFVAFATPQDQIPGVVMEPAGDSLSQPDLTKARLAELDELRLQHMISETDYQRRRDELLKPRPTAG
jgi:hypothetical protein